MNAHRIKNLKLERKEKKEENSYKKLKLIYRTQDYTKLGPYQRELIIAPKGSLPKACKDHVL